MSVPHMRMLPAAETAGLFEGLARGACWVQRCDCGVEQLPARAYCVGCGAETGTWGAPSEPWRVVSHTLVERPPTPAFAARVPYLLGLLGAGPHARMVAFLDHPTLEPSPGDPVDVRVVGSADEGYVVEAVVTARVTEGTTSD